MEYLSVSQVLEIVPTEKNVIVLDKLAAPYSKHLCEHVTLFPKQATSQKISF